MFYFFSGLIILTVFLLITLDILFIPTSILTFFSLISFFGYLFYVYTKVSTGQALILLIIFFFLGTIYIIIILKFRLWRNFSHEGKLSLIKDNLVEELKDEVGKTITELKPLGLIKIKSQKKEGLAINGFIEKDKMVKVVGRSGAQLKVQSISKE